MALNSKPVISERRRKLTSGKPKRFQNRRGDVLEGQNIKGEKRP